MRRKTQITRFGLGVFGVWLMFAGLALAPGLRAENTAPFPADVPRFTSETDSGPATFLNSLPANAASADYCLDGAGDFRFYFNYQPEQYYFLERKGVSVTAGLCRAGLTRVLGHESTSSDSLRLARHGNYLALFARRQLLLSAFVPATAGGQTGLRMLQNQAPVKVELVPREEIHFADDFMISEGKPAQWRGNGDGKNADFIVHAVHSPALSVNAFCLLGAGKEIHAAVGEPWWDQYRYRAAMRGPAGGKIGLVFAYQDDRNYGLFRWSARETPKNTGTDEPLTGRRELVRVTDGQETVLASGPGGYAPDQWYEAVLEVSYSKVSLVIDRHTLLETDDPLLAAGGAGVWCDVPVPEALAPARYEDNCLHELVRRHAAFNNVRIDTLHSFADDFRVPGPLGQGWQTDSGRWRVEGRRGEAGRLLVEPGAAWRGKEGETPPLRKALIGIPRWANYRVEATVENAAPGVSAGLVLLYRDESDYYTAVVEEQRLILRHSVNGTLTQLDAAPLPSGERCLWRLCAQARQGHLRITAAAEAGAGEPLASVEFFEPDGPLKGRAGVCAQARQGKEPAACAFSKFMVTFPPEPEPLLTVNPIYDHEESMRDWASAPNDWFEPVMISVDDKKIPLYWHRSQFPGDVEVQLAPEEIKDPAFEVTLAVSKDCRGKDNGYIFRLRAKDGEVPVAELIRQGTQVLKKEVPALANAGRNVSEKTTPAEKALQSLGLRRTGKYVIALLNGRPLLVFKDEQPLTGGKLAFYAVNLVVRPQSTQVISPECRTDMFTAAPTAWRKAGAVIAEVANRWQCTPTWTFFSLKNDRAQGKPAVLWSKALYPGDVTLEFYVAHKMEVERGVPYAYARDINVTLCSDGHDLNHGYTCMWGGFKNSGSMILRDGAEVRKIPARIPTAFDRGWTLVRIDKRGRQIHFSAGALFDSEPGSELVFEDDQPLSGNRIAIWTYDHAIMLSRVRISGPGGESWEDPDFVPGILKTPYDTRPK